MSSNSNKFDKGSSFEEKLVQCLLSDHKFAEQMIEVLNINYFDLEYLRDISSTFFNYYKKYKAFPSLEMLPTVINDDRTKTDASKMKISSYFSKIKASPLNGDMQYIKETSLDFCRKQSLMLALTKVVDLTEKSSYDEIIGTIQKALQAGAEKDLGHFYDEDIDKRMIEEIHVPVPTGWERLNKITRGGPGSGRLCTVIGGTGVGKSHFLVAVGAAALKNGMKVAHFTFELSQEDIARRYDSNISQIPYDEVIKRRSEVEQAMSLYNKGKLWIKEYPTKSASIQTIRNSINRVQMLKSFKPDIIVIDYADIMRSTKSYESKRFEQESVYEDLRSLSMELGIPIWTASQTNRSGYDQEVVKLTDISESFAKCYVSDLVMTISKGYVHIAKNRMGPDGITFPIMMNTQTSTIRMLDKVDESVMQGEGALASKSMAVRYQKMIQASKSSDI